MSEDQNVKMCDWSACEEPATVLTSQCVRIAGAPYRWETRHCAKHARAYELGLGAIDTSHDGEN